MDRYLNPLLFQDLKKKMVLLSGPRQCGKTTAARQILKQIDPGGIYLNWDDTEDRKTILKRSWSEAAKLVLFDEIHKYHRWKSWLKGLYDTRKGSQNFLVTGSARLDVYRKGGDSMFGRYHPWRLHPFCLAECPPGMSKAECLNRLMERGGFPEPFFSETANDMKRWRRERRDLVLREDIRDLEKISDITSLSLLLDLLATRVSSPVVYANLAEDLDRAHKTIKHWVEILERMYLVFAVPPFTGNLPRAFKKPPKIYFYDNGEVEAGADQGPRFENLVATHLLKRIHFLEDSTGDRFELRYIRDKEGHEVDFVILKNRKALCLIEAKWSDSSPHSGLRYFAQKLNVPRAIQIVGQLGKPTVRDGIEIVPAQKWLARPLDAGF